MSRDSREALFANLDKNYEKILAREIAEQIEVPQFADDAGNAAVWHIKPAPGWTYSVMYEYQSARDPLLYACSLFVCTAHDMFGNPIFYDNTDEGGNEISLPQRLETLRTSRDRIAVRLELEDALEIFNKVQEAIRICREKLPTPEEVKKPSNPAESPG